MAQTIQGEPIARGYPYPARITVTGSEVAFPFGATLRAQVRDFDSSVSAVAELTTENGGITRISDTELDILIKAEDTAKLRNTVAVMDFARTDPTPDVYLYLKLTIPVVKAVTVGAP